MFWLRSYFIILATLGRFDPFLFQELCLGLTGTYDLLFGVGFFSLVGVGLNEGGQLRFWGLLVVTGVNIGEPFVLGRGGLFLVGFDEIEYSFLYFAIVFEVVLRFWEVPDFMLVKPEVI